MGGRARSGCFCLLLLAATGGARAADDPAARGFDPAPARPALSLDGGFVSETASTAPARTWRAEALFDVASGLLTLEQGSQRQDLLASRGLLHLLGGWSFGKVEVGAHLPIAIWQSSDLTLLTSQGVSGPLVAPIASSALGDLRLGAKLAILDELAWPVGLAAMIDLRLPTGNQQAFLGDGLSVVPSVIASRRFGRVRLDGQVGYQIRGQGQYAQLVVHDGLVYTLGTSIDLPPLARLQRWRGIAEITGLWPRGNDLSTDRYRAALSARAGLRAFISQKLAVEGGVGAGLGPAGYGHERWRAFFGVSFGGAATQPAGRVLPGDRDGDGVPDDEDLCPDQPGLPENDGCPDRDADGIPDREDKCPDQPGDAEHDGCPAPAGQALVEIDRDRFTLNASVHFDTGNDVIKKESFVLLDAIARLLRERTDFEHVRVEGHTDNVGSAAVNRDLSRRRAEAVIRYLVTKGVAPERLTPIGHGFDRPIASNRTALGRAKNRRVAFVVVKEAAE